MDRILSCGFLRILTVAFLLFLAPAGRSLNLKLDKPSSVYVKIRRKLQLRILHMIQKLFLKSLELQGLQEPQKIT